MANEGENTAFTLVFRKGLAERNRLPIEQVIKTLQEFQEMIREVGRQVQRRNGVENADGDFGIELLASPTGLVFRKGSLKANAAATRDLANAKETLTLIYSNVRSYSKPVVMQMEPTDALIARRMYKIGELQREAKTELAVVVKTSEKRAKTAILTEKAIVNLETVNAPQMRVGGMTLYGRLRQLNDRSKEDDGGKYFWGELHTDAHEKWRLRFVSSDVVRITPMFRGQVVVTGNATYFGAQSPRLDVSTIFPDPQRNYLNAFAELSAAGTALFGDADSSDLLKELYG
jgi:hypothetical protein